MRKRRVESCLALDVNELRRKGALAPGAAGRLTWERQGAALASVTFRSDTAGLVLCCDAQDGEAPRAVEQRLTLSSSPAGLGGARVYFLCPGVGCGRRAALLYFAKGAFRCRRCHGLAYESQREDVRRRAKRRAGKLGARIGAASQPRLPLWLAAKPKGMWRRTFERVLARSLAADDLAKRALEAQLIAIANRVERRTIVGDLLKIKSRG